MKSIRPGICLCLLAVVVTGCQSLLYELQPHRLRRLNRHPPPSMDPEFSAIDSPAIAPGIPGGGEPFTESETVVRAQR